MLCRCGGRVRVARACCVRKRWQLLLGGNSIGGPVWLQAKTRYTGKISPANDGNSLNILYIDERWEFTLFYSFLKTFAGDMDGHVDRDFTPNSHTSFHYRQNEVGDTGTVYFCSYIQLCSRYFHKNLRIAV